MRGLTSWVAPCVPWVRLRPGAFEESELGLSAVAARVVAEYHVLSEQRDVRVTVRLPGGPTVYADEQALVRAVPNLLSNAVRFSPDGAEITVTVWASRSPGRSSRPTTGGCWCSATSASAARSWSGCPTGRLPGPASRGRR